MYKAWMFKQRSFRLMDPAKGDGEGSSGGSGGDEKVDDKGSKADDGSGAGDGGEGDDEGDGQGKPKPTDAEAKLLKEVMDKKTALRKTQGELDEVKRKLAAFDGLDATELKNLVAERKQLETKKLEEKGEWDRLKAQMAEENQKTVDEVTGQLNAEKTRSSTLAAKITELTIGNSFIASEYIKEELTLPPSKARALYGAHFEANEEGVIVAYDKPAGAATRTQLVDGQGEPLSFDAALKKLVSADPDHDSITKSKMKGGSGSHTQDKGKPPAKTFDEPKGIDRIAAALRAAAASKQ